MKFLIVDAFTETAFLVEILPGWSFCQKMPIFHLMRPW